jgi:hypothetical protein
MQNSEEYQSPFASPPGSQTVQIQTHEGSPPTSGVSSPAQAQTVPAPVSEQSVPVSFPATPTPKQSVNNVTHNAQSSSADIDKMRALATSATTFAHALAVMFFAAIFFFFLCFGLQMFVLDLTHPNNETIKFIIALCFLLLNHVMCYKAISSLRNGLGWSVVGSATLVFLTWFTAGICSLPVHLLARVLIVFSLRKQGIRMGFFTLTRVVNEQISQLEVSRAIPATS